MKTLLQLWDADEKDADEKDADEKDADEKDHLLI